MAITFTWSIKDMHRVADTGAVYKVDWSCSGVDADTKISHSRSGSHRHKESVTAEQVFGQDSDGADIVESNVEYKSATPDHTASNFKAYTDLTEADVLAWCKADGVGAKTEARITSNITNKIAAQVNSTGMPWAAE